MEEKGPSTEWKPLTDAAKWADLKNLAALNVNRLPEGRTPCFQRCVRVWSEPCAGFADSIFRAGSKAYEAYIAVHKRLMDTSSELKAHRKQLHQLVSQLEALHADTPLEPTGS